MSRITGLKNKINKLEKEIAKIKDTFAFQYTVAKEREIIELKQESQCRQVVIDSLELQLDRSEKIIKEANEAKHILDTHIKNLEDKKIKNKIKKLLVG